MSMLRCAFHGLVIAALQLAGFAVAAETSGARCSGPEYGQFDFWLGTWSVTNQGKPAGTNRIEKVLDGCALLETWRSTGAHRGHSLTFYDTARAIWHQTWIDVRGEPLYLEGRFEDGRMRLEGRRVDPSPDRVDTAVRRAGASALALVGGRRTDVGGSL